MPKSWTKIIKGRNVNLAIGYFLDPIDRWVNTAVRWIALSAHWTTKPGIYFPFDRWMFTHANNSHSFIVLQSIPHPSPLPPNSCTPLADPAVRVGLLTDLRGFNPLYPKISMHILQTVLFPFPWVPRRRICLRVMTLISDSGLILYGETSSSFYLLHLKLLVFSPNLSTTSGGKSLVAKALLMMLENSCLQKNKMTENTRVQRCQVEGKQNKLLSSIL